jgi:hypothetical protein
MALTLQVLAQGSVNTGTDTAIYPPSAAAVPGKSALVKNIILTNTGTSTVNVDAKVKMQTTGGTTTARWIAPKALPIPPNGQFVIDSEICLFLSTTGSFTPDYLSLATTNGSNGIEYVVNGLTRDV